jgi:hypothetical protein
MKVVEPVIRAFYRTPPAGTGLDESLLKGLTAHKEELGMAKRGKVLPARRPREEDASILLRSAETIGRVIGTLQRQLDGARGRLSEFAFDDTTLGTNGNGSRRTSKAKKPVAASNSRTPRAKSVAASGLTMKKRVAKSTGKRKATKRARKAI